MITFRKVKETDELLNSKIEELNEKAFPSTESTADLHFLAGLYTGATVDFIAVEDDDVFVGYTYVINFFQGSFVYYLAIEPDYQDKGYGTALLKHLREMQGNRPIALTIFTPDPDNDDYEECLRRKWFYVKNGYVDQRVPYPDENSHRYDILMSGFGIGYIELMAMLNKVNMFINSLISNGRYNL
jgi:ribosomal protein S18 acetylase RimI-like enzyme